ncbi:MAG: acyl-CoA dehydratase activase [Methanocellales archaeon]
MLIGIDIGSISAKGIYYSNGTYTWQVVDTHNWRELLAERKKEDIVIATGYFRKKVPCDETVTEITSAIYGVKHFLKKEIEVIVDIGGQDIKVIDLRSNDFRMNDKCSAGTGAFLELVARYFDLKVEELEKYHFKAEKYAEINSTCSVFALSEIVSKLVEGFSREEIIKGVHFAFANRIAQLIPIDAKKIALIGGIVKNRGVVDALERVLNKNVHVPSEPQIVNAIGAVEYYLYLAKDIS